ncbi:unnamed protein product [Amoebophrya sp. A25]|nr:unnamed protein product [Amoebophrya sp. A25]|eukprot:GSA25T00024897001.1
MVGATWTTTPRFGAIISTAPHRSPKVVTGAEWNEKTDVASFGRILVELFDGKMQLLREGEVKQRIEEIETVSGWWPDTLIKRGSQRLLADVGVFYKVSVDEDDGDYGPKHAEYDPSCDSPSPATARRNDDQKPTHQQQRAGVGVGPRGTRAPPRCRSPKPKSYAYITARGSDKCLELRQRIVGNAPKSIRDEIDSKTKEIDAVWRSSVIGGLAPASSRRCRSNSILEIEVNYHVEFYRMCKHALTLDDKLRPPTVSFLGMPFVGNTRIPWSR